MLTMFISKNQVIGLLLIFLGISGLHYEVSGARWLSENSEKVEENLVNAQAQMNSSNSTGNGGLFATSNREVPSAPDPLHNRFIEAGHRNSKGLETMEIMDHIARAKELEKIAKEKLVGCRYFNSKESKHKEAAELFREAITITRQSQG